MLSFSFVYITRHTFAIKPNLFYRPNKPERSKMVSYANSSKEWKTLLPLYYEHVPSQSGTVPQLDQTESSSMPSSTSASVGYRTPPPSSEDLSSSAPHSENHSMQLPADTLSASVGGPPPPPSSGQLSLPAPHSQTMQLPADTATAPEVREFLHFLLTTKQEISDADAHAITALWKIGGGHQLRTYSEHNFQTIFGPEVGRKLWDDVDTCLENDQMHAKRFAANEKRPIQS
jgi:hypothetical protein